MDDELAVIRDQNTTMQKTLDRFDNESGKDHDEVVSGLRDLQKGQAELMMRVGSLEAELAQLQNKVDRVPAKTGDKVADAVKPITDTLDQVKKEHWWKKHFLKGG